LQYEAVAGYLGRHGRVYYTSANNSETIEQLFIPSDDRNHPLCHTSTSCYSGYVVCLCWELSCTLDLCCFIFMPHSITKMIFSIVILLLISDPALQGKTKCM